MYQIDEDDPRFCSVGGASGSSANWFLIDSRVDNRDLGICNTLHLVFDNARGIQAVTTELQFALAPLGGAMLLLTFKALSVPGRYSIAAIARASDDASRIAVSRHEVELKTAKSAN